MEATLAILNEIEAASLVKRYAIGGAMAAFFYAEAVLTEDLDAFVLMEAPTSGFITLGPIYDFLRQRGATEDREHLWLAGTLLQVIPAFDELTAEAVEQAVERSVGHTRTRVMRVEHLIAIALKTGRPKDQARVCLLMAEAEVNISELIAILDRHGLKARWDALRVQAS